MRWKEESRKRGRNWMSAMGILFMVSAAIIAIRNLLYYSIEFSATIFLDNFTNSEITNEKFVVVMLAIGGFLLYWGYFKKKEDYTGLPDEHERRGSDHR